VYWKRSEAGRNGVLVGRAIMGIWKFWNTLKLSMRFESPLRLLENMLNDDAYGVSTYECSVLSSSP
jgi:hypothetical protein